MGEFRFATLKPEDRLLLQAARVAQDSTGSLELERLAGGNLDWSRLVRKADWYEISALVYEHLEASGLADRVPDFAYSQLSVRKQEQRVRFFFFLQPELLRVLRAMSSAGVEIIPLKGAYLMNTVYPDVSLRPVGDLDVLIQEGDLSLAEEVLVELSYRSRAGRRLVPQGSGGDHHHFPRVLSPDGSVELELHRHLVRRRTPLFFPIERFWERSVNGEIGGQRARILAPRDLVSHLCLAFFLDRRRRTRGYGSLRQLVDLSESIRHFEQAIDWAGMVREYEGAALQGPLYVSLQSARRMLDAPVPEEFLQAFRPRDFDEALFDQFLHLKVTNEGLWFFHDLVDPKDNHWWNITKASIHRLIPTSSYLHEKYPTDQSAPLRVFLEHFREATRVALGAEGSPRSVIQEIRVDTWMNELQLAGEAGF